jgi:hypothetical protein
MHDMADQTMDLSNIELPKMLLNTINYCLNMCGNIKSWNLFDNQKGNVHLNIRFDSPDFNTNGLPVAIEPASYRKLSTQQMERNRHRAQHYTPGLKGLDTNRTIHNSKKRKTHISPTSPELPRTCDISVTPDNVITHSPEAVSWITENPDFHVIATESPSSPHAPPSTPYFPSPPEFPDKTFATAIIQTESTESIDASTSVEIDSSELAKCIAETDSSQNKSSVVGDVVYRNERHIESSLFSKSCEPHIKTPKSSPKPKPPDPKNGHTPILERDTLTKASLRFLTRQVVHK